MNKTWLQKKKTRSTISFAIIIYAVYSVREQTSRHFNLLLTTDRIIQSTAGSAAFVHLFVLHPHSREFSRCVCVRVCPDSISFLQECVCACVFVSQQVQMANTLTCLTHPAPEPLTGALRCSRPVQPLKQAPGLRQRLGPEPRLHSPRQPGCLFSEALEETLDKAYQIQTVARLCCSTHWPPLSSASFSVIVFFLPH